MPKKEIKVGDIIYHKDLQKLLCCRDKYYNHVYDKTTFKEFNKNKIKYYTPDNSGDFHTTQFKKLLTADKFVVINIYQGGGGTGMGCHDIYPEAANIVCQPINNKEIFIKFHTNTNCYAHTINTNEMTVIK